MTRSPSSLRQRNAQLRVLDRPAFAALVSRLRSRAGTQREVAARLGLSPKSQSYVSKLCRGRVHSIGLGTYGALARALTEEERAILLRAVLTPVQEAALEQHSRWLRGHMDCSPNGELSRLAAELWARYPAIFERLIRAMSHWPMEHERAARLAVAEARIVAPLVQTSASGFVEREREEIPATELERYLAAAVRAECVLLNRSSARERVQAKFPAAARTRERRRG